MYSRSITRKVTLYFSAIVLASSLRAQSFPPTDHYTHVVDLFSTQMALAASAQTANQGGSVAFAATLTQATGPGIAGPTGNVTFTLTPGNGGQPITSTVPVQNGSAAWANTPPVGTDTVVAAYSGDLNYIPVMAQTKVTILSPGSPDFDFTLPAVTVQAGQSYNGDISVQALNGFTGDVTFGVGQLPQGVTFTIPSSSIHISAGSSQVFQSSSNTAVPFEIGTEATVVTTLSGFLLLGAFDLRRRLRWRKGYIPLVFLLAGPLAFMVGCACNRFMQSNGAQPGTYSIAITGTSGSLTHTHNLTLIVKQNGE